MQFDWGPFFWGLKRVAEKRKEFLRFCQEKMPLQAFPKWAPKSLLVWIP